VHSPVMHDGRFSCCIHNTLPHRKLLQFSSAFNLADSDNHSEVHIEQVMVGSARPLPPNTHGPEPVQESVDCYISSAFVLGASVRFARTGNPLPLVVCDGTFASALGWVSCKLYCMYARVSIHTVYDYDRTVWLLNIHQLLNPLCPASLL
jgi:hypothetical protein